MTHTSSRLTSVLSASAKAGLFERAPWRQCDVVWHRNGLAVRHLFVSLARRILRTEGYQELLMPALIPDATLRSQPDHYRDVRQISFQVRDPDSCYLRATSEAQFAEYIRARRPHRLPFRAFQICTVFRKESSSRTVPLMRAIEIDPFIETMTFGLDAPEELARDAAIYARVFRELCIPVLTSARPRWDTFPEADTTIAFDAILDTGSITQVGTVHNLGTSFARALNLTTQRGQYLQHTSGGLSGRLLLATIAVHFYRGQITLPSVIAPILAVLGADVARKYPSLAAHLEHSAPDRVLVGPSRPASLAIPLCLSLASGDRLRVQSGLGAEYCGTVETMTARLKTIITNFDAELYARAHARMKKWRRAIHEAPSCADLACLLREAEVSKKAICLGFAVDSGASATHCRCGACSQRLARYTRDML